MSIIYRATEVLAYFPDKIKVIHILYRKEVHKPVNEGIFNLLAEKVLVLRRHYGTTLHFQAQ